MATETGENVPRIIPVVDIMGGRVVHAVAGRRSEYRPVASKLTASDDPVEIANALLNAANADEIYIADLDAILGDGIPTDVTKSLIQSLSCKVLLDHGWRGGAMPTFPRTDIVIPGELGVLPSTAAPGAIFSIDLHHGRPIRGGNPIQILMWAGNHGFRRFIVLDLATVGTDAGMTTLRLCEDIRILYPAAEIITGGGIRDWGDVETAGSHGVDAVLVATALHSLSLVARLCRATPRPEAPLRRL